MPGAAKEKEDKTRFEAKRVAVVGARTAVEENVGDAQGSVNPWIAQGSNGTGDIPVSSKPRNKRRLDDAAACTKSLPRKQVKKANGSDSSDNGDESFIAMASFSGAKVGYVFQKGALGVGYYSTHGNGRDEASQPPPQQRKTRTKLSQEELLVSLAADKFLRS